MGAAPGYAVWRRAKQRSATELDGVGGFYHTEPFREGAVKPRCLPGMPSWLSATPARSPTCFPGRAAPPLSLSARRCPGSAAGPGERGERGHRPGRDAAGRRAGNPPGPAAGGLALCPPALRCSCLMRKAGVEKGIVSAGKHRLGLPVQTLAELVTCAPRHKVGREVAKWGRAWEVSPSPSPSTRGSPDLPSLAAPCSSQSQCFCPETRVLLDLGNLFL